ncbi:hypothetical protein V2J09_013817 [Rumex salicifolius]
MEEEDKQEVKISFKQLGLCDELVDACANLGWKVPTKIQERILLGLHRLVQEKPGPWHFLSFKLSSNLLNHYSVELFPLLELAIQITEQFQALGSGFDLKATYLVGGMAMNVQKIAVGNRPHIIVATPGRLLDHLTHSKGYWMKQIDRLLNEDIKKSIDEIMRVKKIQRLYLKNPVKIYAASKYSTVDALKQQYLFIPAKSKDCYLVYILTEMAGNSTMVFTRTCEETNLANSYKWPHGSGAPAKRLGALNSFKAGNFCILVCTDVASRGLDIPSVDVLDYVSIFIRIIYTGVAISLVNQYELEWYLQIENLIGKKLPRYKAKEEEVMILLEDLAKAKSMYVDKVSIPTSFASPGLDFIFHVSNLNNTARKKVTVGRQFELAEAKVADVNVRATPYTSKLIVILQILGKITNTQIEQASKRLKSKQ